VTNNVWKVIFGAAAAAIAFLLVQGDVTFDPIVKVALGAIAVVLAVLNPPGAK